MEPIIETGKDVVTVISEPGALTFATRKEWEPLPENQLETLNQYEIVVAFKGTGSVYFMLDKFTAPMARYDTKTRYLLVKIANDEDERLMFYAMNLSEAECNQLKQNRLTLWD